jgi:Fur family transcriptional regulator, ferric uptake regulator
MTPYPHSPAASGRRRPAAKDETIAALLRSKGLRHTLPRQAIYRLLKEAGQSESYVDAKELYRRSSAAGDHVGLASIGRILLDFESSGLLRSHSFEGLSKVYALEAGQSHHHVVNVATGQIWHFSDESLEAAHAALCRQWGVEFIKTRTTLYVRSGEVSESGISVPR